MTRGLLIISCRPLCLARPRMSRLDVTPACSEWWSRTEKWYFVVFVMSVFWGQRPLQATQGSVVRHLSEILSLTSLVWFSAVPGVKHSVAVPAGMVGIPPPLLTVITVLWYLQPAWNTCRPSQTRRREGVRLFADVSARGESNQDLLRFRKTFKTCYLRNVIS